jgi:hypothetical protein
MASTGIYTCCDGWWFLMLEFEPSSFSTYDARENGPKGPKAGCWNLELRELGAFHTFFCYETRKRSN